MKKLFIVSLAIFWAVSVALLTAGLLATENKVANEESEEIVIGEVLQINEEIIEDVEVLASSTESEPFASEKGVSIEFETITKSVEKKQYLTASLISEHNTEQNCWLLIDSKVYDVSEYVPFHPGGKEEILGYCGKESTRAFNTRGDDNTPHSASAHVMLERYYVASLGDPWGTIVVNEEVRVPIKESGQVGSGQQTTELTNATQETTETETITVIQTKGKSNFSVGNTLEATSNVKARQEPSASAILLSIQSQGVEGTIIGGPRYADGYWWYYIEYETGVKGWSAQDFFVKIATPIRQTITNTTNTNTTDTQNTSTTNPSGLNSSNVMTHDSLSDCWIIVSNKVYDVTQYIPFHPGGQNEITDYCGKESTTAFNNRGGTGSHSQSAANLLANYVIGDFEGDSNTTQTINTTCSAFTYTSWDACQPDGAQSRSVISSSPSGCSGGSPIISRACTYDASQPDSTAPSIAIISPSDGGIISGDSSIKVTASDINGVTYVEFRFDGQLFETDTNSPYTALLDTTLFSEGSHVLHVRASDPSNNIANKSISVTISNSASTGGGTGGETNGISQSEVATHSSSGNCWIIVSNKVYDVTQYIPFHPGGQNEIIQYCGKESTIAFNNRGGTGNHSNSAVNLLANYLVGSFDTTTVNMSCTSFTYSAWGQCQSDSTQTRTVLSSSPTGCTGGTPQTSQSCTYTPPTGETCTSWTYSQWGQCQPDNTQTRTITSSSPAGCSGGSPQTSQSCTYTPPTCSAWTYSSWSQCQPDNTQTRSVISMSPTGCTGGTPQTSQSCTYTPPGGLSAAEVATHNTSADCWLIISSKVYDVTDYIPFHPGGQNRIINVCGNEATTLFTSSVGQGHNHSNSAHNMLANYLIGDLFTAPVACTSFTYSAWGQCQSDSTQTRTVLSSSPTGCTGGTPQTSQSCTYTPPTGETCTSWTYSQWGQCQPDNTQTRTITSSSPAGCSGGSPVISQSCMYQSAPQTVTVNVNSSGIFDQASLTLNVGDSVRFNYSNPGDEVKVSFTPSTFSTFTLDQENSSRTITFTSAGTWTYQAIDGGSGSGTVTVQ